MRKRIIVMSIVGIGIVMIGYLAVNLLKNNHQIQNKETKEQNIQNISSEEKQFSGEYISVEELNSRDYNNGRLEKTEFNNLVFDDADIYIPKVESVNYISIKGNWPYLGLTDTNALIDKEVEFLDYFIEEEIIREDLWDSSHGISYPELQKQLSEETYYDEKKSMPALTFVGGDGGKPYSYAHVFDDFSTIWFDRGTISDYADKMMSNAEDYYETIKEYGLNDNLEEEYQLLNGTISIRDAVNFVENYFNTSMPYEMNKEAKIKVTHINVLKAAEDVYIYQFVTSRNYKGISFEAGGMAWDCIHDTQYDKDRAYAYMINTDEIAVYCGYHNGNTDSIESTGEITKVVTPESALHIVSEEIGSNSEYKVSKMEIVYRNQIINETSVEGRESAGVPCYKITGINNNDTRETYFYVELETGNISYDMIKGI